jgi:lysophospholipase L1-like esterase
MLRKTLYLLFVATCAISATEFYAHHRFPALRDRAHYEEMAFIRLLNSGVVYRPGGGNYDERFGFLNNPNIRETIRTDEYRYTVHTNSLGFRTHEIEPKPPGQRRLMLLGDSIFFGVGVDYEASLAALLEGMVDSLTVYNFAMLGHNTVQSLIAARAFSDQVEPDHIVCGVFIGNDLISNALNYVDGQNRIAAHLDQIAAMRARLLSTLAPFSWSMALRAWAWAAYIPRLRYQISAEPAILSATARHLEALARHAAEAGSAFTAVLIYPKDAVAGGLVEHWSQSRHPGQLLAHICRERGIEILDLLEHLDDAGDRDRYYFEQDGHLNAAGHALVARLIRDRWLAETDR